MKERRKAVRFKASLDVEYTAKGGIIEVTSKTKSKDISAVGIRIPVNELVKKGTKLTLEIKLPDEPAPIVTHGEVVWVKKLADNPHGDLDAGIKFTEMDPGLRDRLLKMAKCKKFKTQ